MKKNGDIRKWLSVIGLFSFLFLFMNVQQVYATAQYMPGKDVSITLQLADIGTKREGTTFSVYQIGEVTAGTNLSYTLTSAFADTGIDLEEIRMSGKQREAVEILAASLPVTAEGQETAGADGVVRFSGLEQGAYLVYQTDQASYGRVTPFLVFLPYTDETGSEWLYDISVETKAEKLQSNIEVNKVDEVGDPVAGAVLALYDETGVKLTQWETGKSAKRIDELVMRGETYTVKEEKAPEGYLLAESVTFTVGMDETLVKITLIDKKQDPKYSLNVTKYIKHEGEYRSANVSFYAALFWDKACTQRASEVVELKMEKAYSQMATIKNLTSGTFYLAETDPEGNAVDVTSANAEFTNEITNQVVTLTPQQPTAESTIINYFRTPGKYLQKDNAEIEINKSVKNGKKAKKVNEEFYFTLYADAKMHTPIRTRSLELKDEASGKLAFEKLAYGTYYIAESDDAGVPVDETFAYKVSISEENVTVSDINKKVKVDIVNDSEEGGNDETKSTKATEETESKGEKKQISAGKVYKTLNPKTGDTTQLFLYAVLLIGAVIVIVVTACALVKRKGLGKK